MGGQLIKGYSIQGDSLCTTGVVQSWKLYKAQNSSNHNSASIFLIEKKLLKKQDKEQTIKISKRESTNLLRVRHPGVLAVLESLIQDDNVLAFVCQKVEGNISLLLKQNKMQEYISSELELKLFLYPFIQTLQFIHNSLKQAHLAIALDSIYITSQGKWKMAGFGFNQVVSSEGTQQLAQKLMDLSFSAPEIATQGTFSKKSDVFSLGVVIVKMLEYIYKVYKPTPHARSEKQYQECMKNFRNIELHPIISKTARPAELTDILRRLLAWNPEERPNLQEVLVSEWMNDSTLTTVKYLDKISSYESKQQLEFLKGLAGVLDDFPDKVLIRIVIPKLLDLMKYNTLIASIVYIITDLLKKKKMDVKTFRAHIWPTLKTVTQAKETTAQAIYLFVAHYDILEEFIGQPDISTYVMPLYLKCFDCPAKLKQLALSMVHKMSKKSDYQFLKTKILPKMMGLLKDQNIDIRKDTLKALFGILNSIDTQTVSLTILPGLQIARKAGTDPFINAIIARMYNYLGQTLQLQVVSSKILPTLIPYLTDPSTTKSEFAHWKNLIYQMIERIEKQTGKQGDNSSNMLPTYTDNDFKLAEVQMKASEQKKGNYSFLDSYYTSKKQEQVTPTVASQNVNPSNYVSDGNLFSQTNTQTADNINYQNLNFSNDFFSMPKQHPSGPAKTDISNMEPVQKPSSPSFDFDSDFGSSTKPMSKPSEKPPAIFKNQQADPVTDAYNPPTNDNFLNKKESGGSGWNGPSQAKKLKGPSKPTTSSPPPQKQQKKEIAPRNTSDPWSFESKDTFSMNFSGLDTFGSSTSPTSPKMGSNSYKPPTASSSDNPFAEIESGNHGLNFNMNMKMAHQEKEKNAPSNEDIYSYFETEEQSNSKAKPKNNFDDLI